MLLISVIIPIYEVEKEIRRCIDSVIEQTYKNLEIILVDDGSTDNCPSICDNYKEMDDRIIVIHKKNGGLSDARNAGLQAAKGDYILFLDSDDYIKKDSCRRFIDMLDGNPDIVVSEATIIEENKVEHQVRSNLEEGIIYTAEQFLMKAIEAEEWYAPVCYNLYNRKFIIEKRLFFKKNLLHEDIEFLPRVYLCAEKIKYLSYEFYQYVIRSNSITQRKDYSRNIKDCDYIYSEWKKRFDKVENLKLKKKLYGVLAKYYIASSKKFHNKQKTYPEGISPIFLVKYSLTLKDLLKSIFFIMFRKIYVTL